MPRLLTCQTIQALDDLLQALVTEGLDPSMALLQDFLEVSVCQNQPHWSPVLNLVFWGKRQEILRQSVCVGEGLSIPEVLGSHTSQASQ